MLPRHLRFSSFQWWGEFVKTPLENLDTNLVIHAGLLDVECRYRL
jgi:hypothetical protein